MTTDHPADTGTSSHRAVTSSSYCSDACAPIEPTPGTWVRQLPGGTCLLVRPGRRRLVLNPTARLVWALCAEGACFADIVHRLRVSFHDSSLDIADDVDGILKRFVEEGFLQSAARREARPAESTIPARIITLRRDLGRTAHVETNLLPYLRRSITGAFEPRAFDAVDGREAAAVEDARRRLGVTVSGAMRNPRRRGQVGCFLSHLLVLEEISASGVPAAMVLEDDASIDAADPGCHVRRVLDDLGTMHWDIVYLYMYEHHFNARRHDPALAIEGKTHIMRPFFSWCTIGYLASAAGARKILRDSGVIEQPIDLHLQALIGAGRLDAYYVREPVVANRGQKTRFEPPRAGEFESNVWHGDRAQDR